MQGRLKSRLGPAPCLPSALGISLHKTRNPWSLCALEGGGRAAEEGTGARLTGCQLTSGKGKGHRLFLSEVSQGRESSHQALGPAWPPGFSAASVPLNWPQLACLGTQLMSLCSLLPTSSPFSRRRLGSSSHATSHAGLPSGECSGQQLHFSPSAPGTHCHILLHVVKEKMTRAPIQSPGDTGSTGSGKWP